MSLSRPRNDRFTRPEDLLLTRNVKRTFAPKNEINLIRVCVGVNPLILSRFQTIQIAEVFR